MEEKKIMAEEAVLTEGQEVNPTVGTDRECVVVKVLAAMLAKQRADAKSDEQLQANVDSHERQSETQADERQAVTEVVISHDALRESMAHVMGEPVEERKGTMYRYLINGGECVEQFIPFTTRVTEKPLYTTLYETNDERGRLKVRVYESPSRIYFRVDCAKKLGWQYLREVVYGDQCRQYLDECCGKVRGGAVETPSQLSPVNRKDDGRVWA